MPKSRQPFEIWRETRLRVLKRGGYVCARPGCGVALTEETAHIDHIVSGRLGSNHVSNLRALCRRCHVLRLDGRHRGMIGEALRDGVVGADWREGLWE